MEKRGFEFRSGTCEKGVHKKIFSPLAGRVAFKRSPTEGLLGEIYRHWELQTKGRRQREEKEKVWGGVHVESSTQTYAI